MTHALDDLSVYVLPGRVDDPGRALLEAADAERIGFGRVWVAERFDVKEAGVLCGALGATTSIGVGTAVVKDSARSPLLTAALGMTMQGMFPGRFTLGIGRGSTTLAASLGLRRSSLAALEDYVTIVKRLWAGETVSYDGALGTFPSLHLADRPACPPPRLVYGAFGAPKAIEIAARHFDGIILVNYLTVDATRRAVAMLHEALERNHRDPDGFRIIQEVVTAPDHDDDAEKAVVDARAVTNFQIPGIGELYVRLNGWDDADLQRLRAHPLFASMPTPMADQHYRREELLDAASLLPRHWMTDAAAIGSSEEVCDRLEEYRDAGADEILVHGSSPADNAEVVRLWRSRRNERTRST